MNCLFCGKDIVKGRCCSRICSVSLKNKIEYDTYIKKWLSGEVNGSKGKDGYQISGHVRRYLMLKNNYKCSLCGWGEKNPYSGKIPLEIDHIDGNWKNNDVYNLRVICPNCHSLTSTYRGRNTGKGRGSKMRGSRLYQK
jgi:hypothetical protein